MSEALIIWDSNPIELCGTGILQSSGVSESLIKSEIKTEQNCRDSVVTGMWFAFLLFLF